jgi:hypothetical protein
MYNRKNYYLKIVDIQNIVLREKAKGATQKWIYEMFIKNTYRIYYTTFNTYLEVPAKAELSKMNVTH